MKNLIVSFIMLFAFCLTGLSGAPVEEPGVPAAAADAEALRAARDRLAVSLFARGELADKIIEAGLQDRYADLTGNESYSEVRLALLEWINKNLDEAAKLGFYLGGRKPPAAGRPAEIEYKMPYWQINPAFQELVEGVDRALADASTADEGLSLAAQRLFDSSQAPAAARAPEIPGGGPSARGAGSAAALEYADYTLNAAAAERESRALGAWLENLDAALGAAPAAGERAETFARQRRLLDGTFPLYRGFLVALSELKGRAKITGREAAKLEALRGPLRRELAALEALSLLRGVSRRAEGLPAAAPGAKVLLADARDMEKAVNGFVAGLAADPEKIRSAGARLAELGRAFDYWTLRFYARGRLAGLKGRIEGRRFSCVFDRLVFLYLARFFPSAGYVRVSASVARKAGALGPAIEGAAAGDHGAAALFTGGRPLAEAVGEAEEEVSRLEGYSRFNRLMQFLFWDVFANPLCLEPGPRGIAAAAGGQGLFQQFLHYRVRGRRVGGAF